MSKSGDLISMLEEGPGRFASTINGFHLIATDEDDKLIEEKIINMVETNSIQGAIYDLQDAIEFLKRHKNRTIDISEPVL